MDLQSISNLFFSCMQQVPQSVKRCAIGIGNQVYIVECDRGKHILRCSEDDHAYADTIHWLTKLSALELPVPKVLFSGEYENFQYLILNYIEGQDIGLIYPELTKPEKRQIAKEVIEIQKKVSRLQLDDLNDSWTWYDFINEMLDRAESRITQNGYFDPQKVEQLRQQMCRLDEYFSSVQPIAYLDDISTKNLLIHQGRLSGIIDIDWMGVGDSLTFISMTDVALRNMDCETDYIEYLLEEKGCSATERKAFLFYSLLFCVDFMGERGMQFGDKKIAVSEEIVDRLNKIYDDLWETWQKEFAK